MKAKSITGKSTEEIQKAVQAGLEDGFRPTLAIVFISINQDRKAICKILSELDVDIFGATSCGEFINGHGDEGSAVLLLMDLPRESYTILFEDIGTRNLAEVAARLGKRSKGYFKKPALILCSTGTSREGDIFPGNILMQEMESVFGPSVPIYGGMAGDDWSFSGSFVFTSENESDKAVLALVLDEEKVSIIGMAVSGWKPLGITKTITRCEDGWIYTIDDQPALEVYLRYLGKENVPDKDKYTLFEEVGVHFPIQVEDADDPSLRTPFMVDRDKDALKLDFDVPQGTKFRFSVPPDFDIVENVLEKAGELKQSNYAEAEALLIFSCAGRVSALGPMTKMENDGLADLWQAPMAGFFSYGEYGTVHGRQKFHSTTCSWVALKER